MTQRTYQWTLTVIALLLGVVFLFPLYWMFATSVKTASEVFASPPTLWPQNFNLWIYPETWVAGNMATFIWNSVLIASGVTAVTVLLGTGCAYVLARYRNGWIDVGLFLILMLQVMPASVMITPLFVGFHQIGLLDYPRLSVVLAAAAKSMPFFVVLVRATFMSVPQELEQAALVDGNSRIGAFVWIVLPLARNGILVVGILTFMTSFGEYIYSKSMIQSTDLQPASVGLSNFIGPDSTDWNSIMAFSAIYVTPILAVFVLLQRRIVSGLTSGALK